MRMSGYNQTTQEIAKPSTVLSSVRAFITLVHSVTHHLNIDVTRLIKEVLLQQSQATDSKGDITLTTAYTNWYLEALLRQASTSGIIHSPAIKAFVTLPVENLQIFSAEQYSDVSGQCLHIGVPCSPRVRPLASHPTAPVAQGLDPSPPPHSPCSSGVRPLAPTHSPCSSGVRPLAPTH
uniref:Uncharacterized protein n=1 Tax=Callorhinchus milii TaxID=7868 RepID=A0A4W3GCM4_CALMI